MVGSDWRIQTLNRQWERIFGRSAAECTRRDLFAAFPFFAEEHAAQMLRDARADGTTRHFDLELPYATRIERYGVRAVCSADERLVIEVTESALVGANGEATARSQRRERRAPPSRSTDGGDRRLRRSCSIFSAPRPPSSATRLARLCSAVRGVTAKWYPPPAR